MRHLSMGNQVIWVKGLVIECPLFVALSNCPLRKYRALPIDKKFKIVDDMSADQISLILEHHQNCLRDRERPSSGGTT